jgi:hypothetical protein
MTIARGALIRMMEDQICLDMLKIKVLVLLMLTFHLTLLDGLFKFWLMTGLMSLILISGFQNLRSRQTLKLIRQLPIV